MRVLWVVNIVLPQIAHLVDGRKVPTGGWIGTMTSQLAKIPGIELGIVTRASVPELKHAQVDGIDYFLMPAKSGDQYDVRPEHCREVLEAFNPDLLHVEGTEFSHAKTMLSSWNGPNVVSLQGIINGYEPYQYGGLQIGSMLFSGKAIPALTAASLVYRKHALFMPRLKDEVATIKLAKNLLGRTTWDRAHAYAINPSAQYFSCPRILRPPFYEKRWSLESAEKHTIFIGNSGSPLKGAHFVLHALAQLKREYPNVKVYIAGEDPYPKGRRSLKKWISYPAYLRYLVRTLGLEKHVEFTGLLQANDMAERMRSVHAYVLCSTIENSPNTLGEAMIMGVPAVAAFTGGAPDMATDGAEALFYRDNDPKLLAFQIKRIFDDPQLAEHLSANARKRALVTHDPGTNAGQTLSAYEQILGRKGGEKSLIG
jgi:glycosyltransferase involved in cell wall biosynthesis